MRSGWRIAVLAVVLVAVAGVLLVRARPATSSGAAAAAEPRGSGVVRQPAVAGAFYPGSAAELRTAVEGYLAQASEVEGPGELVAFIVPHAGYVYSAPVAAWAYRQLEGKHFDAVAVIGPSHQVPFAGIALSAADQWATPLGEVAVDRAGCEAIRRSDPGATISDIPHAPEHSIEVQLPFLQMTLKEFRLLPVLMQDYSRPNCEAAARAIAEYARGRSVLLIASSDMSHYPSYSDAVRVDGETLKAITSLDPDRVAAVCADLLRKNVPNLGTCLCGEGPVRTVLMAARMLGADRAKVLRYANSGDIPGGPRDRVVGYGAIALYRTKAAAPAAGAASTLSPAQRRRLLALARSAIETYVRSGKRVEVPDSDPAFGRPAAAFVTLKERGELRGCIGSLEPDAPLAQTVRDRAINAATGDPRFPPVAAAELPLLEIEISVLSPVRRVASADEIDIRKHGVIVESGLRRGVFLPQVAQETGWDRDTLLSRLCEEKAGLPADAWRKGAALYVFTVEAFGEPAPGK
jgi:hypothetical protein